MKHSKNNKKYQQLSQYDRDRLDILLNKGHTQKDIADVLNRSPSTISREIARNRRRTRKEGQIIPGKYESRVAQMKRYNRRRYAKYQGKKIEDNYELKQYIINGLKNHWSPDEISGKMRTDGEDFYASKNLIYEWIYSTWGQRYVKYLCTKRWEPRKRKKKVKKVLIPNRIGLESRSIRIDSRVEYGHFEADTIVSGRKTGSKNGLAVVYERKSRYISAKKISSLKPMNMNRALEKMNNELIIDSLTMDNGIENQYYEELGIPTYFCDAYSSWQKGGVENANRMIRRFIPKGMDLSKVTKKYLEMVLDILNDKPRKSLGYRSAREVAIENGLLLED